MDYDVIVVGAGLGGIYAVHRFQQQGLSVLCLEAADGVGGVWRHNAYPGSRVDVESTDYCYHFSKEIFEEWRWSERYAAQPELLAYLDWVTDRLDLRQHMRFNSPLTDAIWDPSAARYRVRYGTGSEATAQFLVMATGNLSDPRDPPFEGLDEFAGDWVQTSRWPNRPVEYDGRRVAIIGTGSSGVQCVPPIAERAEHLYVFQRTPHFSVPAQNGPHDKKRYDEIVADVAANREYLLSTGGGVVFPLGTPKKFAEYTPEERLARLQAQYDAGGQGMLFVFADQNLHMEVNNFITDFLRAKIKEIVRDPEVAEKLMPRDYPIGTKRLALDIGYYESFNRDNVTLVDCRSDPIERITKKGILTKSGTEYELDLIIFALGFYAFKGCLERINIRNEVGEHPTEAWKYGPRAFLGLMTEGFANLFLPTAPGSPSVNANLFLQNEFHIDWIAECIAHMRREGFDVIRPTTEAIDEWTAHMREVTEHFLNRQFDNYKVQVNPDGSRVFWPYLGGFGRYVETCREVARNGYEGFVFERLSDPLAMPSAGTR